MQIKGYLSNQWGFSESGRILVNYVKNIMQGMGITILDPFEECGKEFDSDKLAGLTDYEVKRQYLEEYSRKITPINNMLMRQSHCMLAVFDGGPSVDDGVASEVGYYAALVEQGVFREDSGKIFALRTDWRLAENIGCIVNAQIEGYIYQTGGTVSRKLDEWFECINHWHKKVSKL